MLNYILELLSTRDEKAKAREVISSLRNRIVRKNYFGWRSFIDDVLSDVVGHMIKTNFEKPLKHYIICGMQSAIDHCRYCNAKKRRGNYETVSLDEIGDVADLQQANDMKAHELYASIILLYGKEVANSLKGIIFNTDDTVDVKLLKKIKTDEFKEFLRLENSRTIYYRQDENEF